MREHRTFDPSQARALFDKGLGCNAIARELGCSPSTVSGWARREKLSFERSQTAMATEARSVDLEAAHVRILGKLALGAERAATRMLESYTVHGFGESGVLTHTLEEPPAEAMRNFATSAGVGVDKIGAFLAKQSDPSLDAAKSLAASLADGFRRFADSNTPPSSPDDTVSSNEYSTSE